MDPAVLEEILVQFRTMDDAARQGLIKAVKNTGDSDIEWGGIIFQDPETGTYYNAGNGPMEGGKDHIEIRGTRKKKGDKLAGAYHSHPKKDTQGIFSEDDVSSAHATGVPFYMGQAHNLEGHVYDPKKERKGSRNSVKQISPQPGKPFMPGEQMVPVSPEILALLRN